MNFSSAILLGLKEIWAHKFRSFLTMLGIILGVSSLVAMSALVKGMENGMREALIAIGGLEKIMVEQQPLPPEQKHLQEQAVGVTMNDVYALQKSSELVHVITPFMGTANVRIGWKGKHCHPWIFMGTWPSALTINQHVIAHGRMFNDIDDEMARNVCVIGSATRDSLFGTFDEEGKEIIPIGERLNINGHLFTIIGMFQHYESEQEKKKREFELLRNPTNASQTKSKQNTSENRWKGGGFVFGLKNSTVYIPLNTMWIKFRASTGTNNVPDPRLSTFTFKIKDLNKLEPTLQQVRNILMHTHRGIEDFSFRTQEGWAENITTTIRNFRLSGGIIAAISLIVGGIGIMNIMFASITERVREIGIRKAIGATTSAVFIQILVESIVISVIGGLAGLLTSLGLVRLLATLSPTDNAPEITISSVILAFLFSAAIGMLAGVLPAIKASRLDPIEALRYE